jgi:hypothetical protein
MLLEDGQELRLKHVGAIINKTTVQQIGINIIYVIVLHRKCTILNLMDQPYEKMGRVTAF